MSRKAAWPKTPAGFVDKNLTGHKLLGLALCAVLYLLSLSGAVTVFYVDMERWETAHAPEFAAASPQAVAAAIADIRADHPKAEFLGAQPPTPELPRLVAGADEAVRVYHPDGRPAGDGDHPITHGLTGLHYALTLPSAIGLPVVGLAGLGLAALIIGGFLSHPRIFRDAYLWRWRSGARLNRADLHNRIGVWAAPFHLMIALTGAVIGLASLVLFAAALVFHQGDTLEAAAPLFSPAASTAKQGPVGEAAVVRALQTVQQIAPGARPSYVAVNNYGTDHESLAVTVQAPNRLAYGESYEFDGRGALVGSHQLTDGPAGKQVYASLYKLHFGSYGGLALKWLYALLGAGLCLVCASGMELWLIKSAQQGRAYPRLRKLWAGFVWATPTAMAAASLAVLATKAPFTPVFWGLLVAGSAGALLLREVRTIGTVGRLASGAAVLALAGAHATIFKVAAAAPAALGMNLSLALIGAALCAWGVWRAPLAANQNPLPGTGEGAMESKVLTDA